MTDTALDVEVPDHQDLINNKAEQSILAAIRMIEAGEKPGPILTMIYLFGYFDGLVQV